jgi:hypothetical protein
VKCKHILGALGCAVLALSTIGCGAFKGSTNSLQSITLNVSLINGTPPSGQSGFVTLVGNGGTIQLQPMGNYGGGTAKDLTKEATYTVVVDPLANVDAFNVLLDTPCFGPCPVPYDGIHGTVEWDATGLVTAVEPATCTFVDTAPLDSKGNPQTPSWMYVGDYEVTATYAGVTSQPVYIPVASSGGNPVYGGEVNNPDGYCDSGSY